ncbi:MAG TPA: SurA N-terminal domain-containing protein [Candidatus Saccharibacteria bacterium]|nr:SurA N-terminal domain-containing protein [Candidatus Saccharibacteria bacterium]
MKDDIIKSDHESNEHLRDEDAIDVVKDNNPEIISGNGKSSKKRPVIIGLVLLLVVGLGLFQWLVPGGILNSDNNDQQIEQSIVIGDTTITQSDVDRYAKGIENYKKQRPTVVIEGEPKQVALDDLIMHAALLKEAKDNNLSLSDTELRELYKIPSKTSIDDYYKYKEANKSSDGVDYYEGVTQENGLLRQKLEKKLIRDQNLFYVTVNFDSPFFNKQKDKEKLQELHDEAKTKLQNDILPLFEKGTSKEKIIDSVDVNNIGTTKQDFTKIADLYAKQLVVSANEIKNYASNNENVRYINLKELGKTDGQSVSQSFRDLDVDYGIEVPDLKNTNEEIAKLQKDGDHTTVFASKTGTYMIARLEKTGGGDYSTWQAFLDKYKNDYVPKDFKVSLSAVLNKVFAVSAQPFNIITSVFDQKAKAQGPPDGCGNHTLDMSVAMIDRSGAGVNGSVYIGQQNGTYCPGSPRVTGNGYALTTGNCWNGNAPYFGGTAPSGYRIVGYIPGDYTVEGANNTGDYNAYVVVERTNNKTISGTSSMVSDDGSSFGGGRSVFSHTITYSNLYPYLSNDYGVSGSWNVPGGQSSYTITASAPGSFTTNRGTWTVIGSTTKDRPANVGNNWHADIQFRYTLSQCTGNCCPGSTDPSCNPPNTPTCSLSVSPVGTLNADGSGEVVVSWSSTNNQSGSISPIIGTLGRAGEADSRFGGSRQVRIDGPTTFTGTWKNTDANPDRSVSCSDGTDSTPQPPSSPMLQPYMRVYGNDVIVGSVFKNDAGVCDTTSINQGITGVTGSEIVDDKRVFTGASGQFAVFDNSLGNGPDAPYYGSIKRFFSDNQRSNASVDNSGTLGSGLPLANDLTFGNHYSRYIANTFGRGGDSNYPDWIKINSGRVPGYGGNSGVVMCIPNYYGDTQTAGATPVTGGKLSDIAGSLTSPIANGQRKVLLVNGDLFIDKDIKYEYTSWNSVPAIPNVTVIVKGNIRIDKDVTQLDGIYVAQPKNSDSGNNPRDGGLIYTCSQQNDPYPVRDLRENCGKQLVINGSFISKKVIFHRTKGSVHCMEELPATVPCTPAGPNERASSDNIAEVFNFSPEAYLTPLSSKLETSAPYQKYDYITSLPPVL